MKKLEAPDWHVFSSAVGWLELGNHAEARAELETLGPEARKNEDVLELSWLIYAEELDWKSALASAESLIGTAPERPSGWLHRAYAFRRVTGGGIQSAWESLLPAAEQFPEEPIIPYNLSCYACQMNRIDEAREWLRRAVSSGGKARIKSLALADSDLEALWPEIKHW